LNPEAEPNIIELLWSAATKKPLIAYAPFARDNPELTSLIMKNL